MSALSGGIAVAAVSILGFTIPGSVITALITVVLVMAFMSLFFTS